MDWLGALLQLVGRWRIAYRKADAFLWSITGRSIWVVWYFSSADYPIVLVASISILFEFRAYLIWRKYEISKQE